MRYIKKTTTSHSLELTGSELTDFMREELQDSTGEFIELPEEVDSIHCVIPSGGDYSGMSIPIGEMNFLVEWNEETEEVEENEA